MSCFGQRTDRVDLTPAHATLHTNGALSSQDGSPTRRNFSRNRTYNSNRTSSKASSEASSFTRSRSPVAIPIEDLGATKRRLVCIRRQSDAAPVNLSVGFKSRTGWQPLTSSRENQDSLALVLPLPDPLQDYSLFAVFDGHGRAGHRVSSFVAEHISATFSNILTADKTVPADVALRRACLRTNRALMAHRTLDISMTGTTAAVAVVHGRSLICANVGDSRIVAGSVRNGVVVPIPLTNDHLPEHPAERKRIEEAGGRVESWTPAGLDTGPPRVWLKERRLPGLSMSRVMGDSILRGIITAEPEMTSHQLAEEDRFIVVATDGIWGQMTNEEVINFVAAHAKDPCQRVAEGLVKHAAALWFNSGGESIDDISVILIRLNW